MSASFENNKIGFKTNIEYYKVYSQMEFLK